MSVDRRNTFWVTYHGSGTSSTPAFLNAVHPTLAIFQVGHGNRYKHPKAQVYARYGEMGIARLRTDVEGAVVLAFGDGIGVTLYRASRPRYWHGH